MNAEGASASRRVSLVLPLCLVGQMIGILLGRSAASPGYGWLALPFALAACVLCTGRSRMAALVLLTCAAGCVTGWYGYHPDTPAPGTYRISGIVCDEIVPGDRGQVKTRLCALSLDGEAVPGEAYWSCYPAQLPPEMSPGCQVSFTGRVYEPSAADNPGGFDFHNYLLGSGTPVALYGDGALTAAPAERFSLRGWLAAVRHRLSEKLYAVMGEEAGAYASAMLLGAKAGVPEEDRTLLSRLGAAHVLVVSGFHVGVLAAILSWLMRGRSLRARTAVVFLTLAGYALLTGGHTPVMRALMLYVFGQIGRMLHRPRPLLWSLCASAMVTLALAPAQLTSASFQLTYAAVLGIAVVSPWLKRLGSAAYTLGAQAGVILPVLFYFHEWPVLGTVLNIVLIPAVSAVMALYWAVLAALPLQPLAQGLGMIAGEITAWMAQGLRGLSGLPCVSLWTQQANLLTGLSWAAVMLALSPLVRFRRRGLWAAAGLCVLALSVTPMPHGTTEFTLFSEGDAEASLLWDRENCMVVDTGEDGRVLSGFLHQQRESIDTLVLTHLHEDHVGGLREIVGARIPVGEACLPWGSEPAGETATLLEKLRRRGTAVRYLARGDVLPLPSGEATVLWPERARVRSGADANSSCLVMHVCTEGVSVLLTGDLPGSYARYVACGCDVLKAAHHGAAEDTTPAFLSATEPAAVLVSCGRSRDLTALRACAKVYDTASRGALTVRMSGGSFSIEGHKE